MATAEPQQQRHLQSHSAATAVAASAAQPGSAWLRESLSAEHPKPSAHTSSVHGGNHKQAQRRVPKAGAMQHQKELVHSLHTDTHSMHASRRPALHAARLSPTVQVQRLAAED